MKHWKGCLPPRRCNECLARGSQAGVACSERELASIASNVAARSGRGSVGASFPERWSRACSEVRPLHLGRLCAVLMRDLQAHGATRDDKAQVTKLATECWSVVTGVPAPSPTLRPTSKSAGGPIGGPGLLATTERARGRKALAIAELVAAMAAHAPALRLGEDLACVQTLLFLPCQPDEQLDGEVEVALWAALEAALAAVRSAGVVFAHVHRVWAVRAMVRSAAEAATAGVRLLNSALNGAPSAATATFAIRCNGFPPRTEPERRTDRSMGSKAPQASLALVTAIAEHVQARVDLVSPEVTLFVRGVDVGGVRVGAVGLEARGVRAGQVAHDSGDDVASEGRPYFMRDLHGSAPQPAGPTSVLDDAGLHCLVQRLKAAIAMAEVEVGLESGLASGLESGLESGLQCMASDVDDHVDDGNAAPHAPASESNHAARRRKMAAGHAQTKALSRIITSCASCLASGCKHRDAANRLPSWTVEYGAGRGSLSKRLATDVLALGAPPLGGQVLLDRSCSRGGTKQACQPGHDRWVENDGRVLGWRTLRLRIDIRHLYLPGLDELRGASVVAVGKHVCGVATDLMLRSLMEPFGRGAAPHRADSHGQTGFSCETIAVALCCHHLCTYDDYVDPSFVERAGISAAEFALVCRLSSWAANAEPSRRYVGMTCKAFLDAGRCVYLRERGFSASLLEYCSPEESPENRMLLARPVSKLTPPIYEYVVGYEYSANCCSRFERERFLAIPNNSNTHTSFGFVCRFVVVPRPVPPSSF